MRNAPLARFPVHSFDPRRLRLADLDGTGAADLVYFDDRAYVFLEPVRKRLLRGAHRDRRDHGRSGAPRTKFYLADKAAGQPWAHPLPFPVHVVEKVEVYDADRRHRFVQEYSYDAIASSKICDGATKAAGIQTCRFERMLGKLQLRARFRLWRLYRRERFDPAAPLQRKHEMTTTVPLCLLCANELPPAALDGETLSPMFCDRHRWSDARAAGIIGFPNLSSELYAPVDELTIAVHDRRVMDARRSSEPSAILLEIDSGDLLILFPAAHRTTFAQFVPRGAIAQEALRALPSFSSRERSTLAGAPCASSSRHT